MTTNNDALVASTSTLTHGALQSALVGARRAVSNVNSTALDQFRPNMFPMQFHTIRLNTDLNHVPHDWAKMKFQCNGFNNSHQNSFSTFSSVNMAHNYKHLVGRVDVISSSKNIKDLLKMPYQKSPHISLMVHRLGKTLLLEEFDVHKNLLKKDAENWQWLKDFFQQCMKHDDKNSSLAVMNSPKKDPLSDEMYKNLIRHSITASVGSNACITVEPSNEVPQSVPHIEEEFQDLKGFHHESLWKFQGRSMLVDSDLPIFGTDSRFPCISLRLRDSPPISVLTGLDYWLDNLMSNVPEVAMVYHLNGFVQKYEILRTEDIPHIENSSFDPEEVMGLACNMMAFIKSRAAVEGHTYWLYKSENDDMVKLYDLTEYCKNELRQDDNPFTVPVGLLCYHVGRNLKMSNQRRSADCRAMLENCLRLLIEDKHPQICADAHFQLADMWVPDKSLYDIWQGDGKIADPPDDLYDENDDICESEGDSAPAKPEGNVVEKEVDPVKSNAVIVQDKRLSPRKDVKREEEDTNQVALQELVVRGMKKDKAWEVLKVCRIAGETDERCRAALSHIRKALSCIDKDLRNLRSDANTSDKSARPSSHLSTHKAATNPNSFSSSSVDVERDQIRVAKPFVPIPLHYSPLKPRAGEETDQASSNRTQEAESFSVPQEGNSSSQTDLWHSQLKFQLLRKAAIAFYILANQFHDGLQRRGHTLRYVRYGLHCYECLSKQGPNREPDVLQEEVYFHLIHLAAKARCCLEPAVWETSRKDFEELNEEEAAILHSAQAILQTPKESWIYTWSENEEKNLKTARDLFKKLIKMKAYEKKSLETRNIIKRQLGVCMMNLGSVYHTQITEKVTKNEMFSSIEPLMEKSKKTYDESISLFLKLNEKSSAGMCGILIYNMYEQAAQALEIHNNDVANPISREESKIHQKMFDTCERTLTILERDESADDTRERVYCKMRDKYFQLATRYFPAAEARYWNVFKLAKDLLYKSLSYCFLDPKSRHVKDSQRIAAIAHYNLARFFKTECDQIHSDSPRYRALCRKMYDHGQSSFDLYCILKRSKSQVEVKRFLMEIILKDHDYGNNLYRPCQQKKTLRYLLFHCCELHQAVDDMHTGQVDKDDDCQNIPTLIKAVKVILDFMNKAFMRLLKLEKTGEQLEEIKSLYVRSLSLTSRKELEFIAFPLSQLLTDVKHFIGYDHLI